jgi:translation initiation factor IF-1
MDRGGKGWVVFGSLRALRGGDEKRAVGINATVIEELPSLVYRLELTNKQQVLAHGAGAVERNWVRLLPGDRVEVEFAEHDPTRARITKKIY